MILVCYQVSDGNWRHSRTAELVICLYCAVSWRSGAYYVRRRCNSIGCAAVVEVYRQDFGQIVGYKRQSDY